MQLIFILALFAGIVLGDAVLTKGDYFIQEGNTIPSPGEDNGIRLFYTVDNTTAGLWEVFPCFGEYDWYIGVSFLPTATNYTSKVLWSGSASSVWGFNNTNFPEPTITVYFLFVGKADHGGTSGKFDILFFTSEAQGDLIVPVAGNTGTVDKTLANDGGSGSISWTPTDDPQDNYTVYYFKGNQHEFPDGDTTNSACAVRNWMTVLDSSIGSVTFDSKNNKWTANVKSLGGKPITLVPLADRPTNYSIQYEAIVLNGVASVLPSFALLFLVFFAFL